MPARTRLSLDGQWWFSPADTFDPENSVQITVPAPWQADERFRDHTGVGWYRREVEIPQSWLLEDRVIILGFGAVDYSAEVWWNDVKVGEHEGGYLPFEIDVTSAARAGSNTITVRVDDPIEIFPEIPHGKQSWYGMLSGIWQPVWIESRARTHIQRIKVTPHRDSVDLEVILTNPPASHLTIEILDPDGTLVRREEIVTPDRHYRCSDLPIPNPRLWEVDSPNLYTLRASTTTDELFERFGLRTIEARQGMIWFNGRPFYLRGALDQDYYPDLICTPPSQEYIEAQFRKAKEMGLNCLRIHIKVADPRYYAAADKIGLLIWAELPNHNLLSESAKRRACETLAGMVERDWNHPSIGIWTIINESWGVDLTDASQRRWLVETYDWLKELDPTRLVVDNSACWGNAHVKTDIADFHVYQAMPDHADRWRAWIADYARRPSWLFAYDYGDHNAWSRFLKDPWKADGLQTAAEVKQTGEEPLLVSEFGNWGLPDVAAMLHANGGSPPWWFDSGLDWASGVVYPHGIEERFRAYHLDRIFPSLTALIEASQELQLQALKYEIEQMRCSPAIQGYVITEFTDVHWEANGLLDMYRHSKVDPARLAQINTDDVLIPVWDRLVFSSGQTLRLPVALSHYSSLEIQRAVLRWELQGDPSKAMDEEIHVGATHPYQVTSLGEVHFVVPTVEVPTRMHLQLSLVQDGALIASNQQELYVFPSDSLPAPQGPVYAPALRSVLDDMGYQIAEDFSQANLAVVTILDDRAREFLLGGGKVLFLAEEAQALQTYIPQFGLEARQGTPWQGDWAGGLGWHRFGSIPTGGVVDFAFTGLTPEHVIHGFAPREFANDVFAGLFVGWLHRPIPTIARRRLGKGTLLASTFRLSKHLETNVLAKYLLRELLNLL